VVWSRVGRKRFKSFENKLVWLLGLPKGPDWRNSAAWADL